MTTVIADCETTYPISELFFSYTDPRGVIRSGNDVFRRVSGYEWNALRGAPHRIVRHPEMPKAVFWILWDAIKRGEPLGAYVRNRTKAGGHYWVYAVVTPVPFGFLSIRLRPSSPLFAAIKSEYEGAREAERNNKAPPEEHAKALLQRLAAHDFEDYASFMAVALGKEMEARDAALGRARDQTIQSFWDLLQTAKSLLKHSNAILSAFRNADTAPMNMRIISSRLGQSGASLGVLAVNYSSLTDNMRLALDGFQTLARKVHETIVRSFFLSCIAKLQREMLQHFDAELAGDANQRDEERALLLEQQAEYTTRALSSLETIKRETKLFQDTCADMNRLSAGLEVTRIIGKMECSVTDDTRLQIEGLLDELGLYQRTISTALTELGFGSTQIQRETSRLVRMSGGLS